MIESFLNSLTNLPLHLKLQQRIAREMGHGDIEITEELKEEHAKIVVNNQTRSLDQWIDYLASDDAPYPDWSKYWALRSVVNMGKYEKKEDEQGGIKTGFTKRDKSTVASLPPLNSRALAMTIGAVREKVKEEKKPKKERQTIENLSKKLSQEKFQQLLSTENFSKIYAQFLEEQPEYSTEGLQETRGKWIKYDQSSDPEKLVKSLESYPLEWCTADYDTAKTQLQGGDFYVYYSLNDQGKAVVPRLAIRMKENEIGEDPRGIAPDQNLDPYIGEVLEKKLEDFGEEGKKYKKKSADMKRLTKLEEKVNQGQELTKDDLIFLYEIDSKIEGFGNQKDPRIKELLSQREPLLSASIVFDCQPEQIAHNEREINKETKAYIGELYPGIFDKLANVEHIYTSFPEGRIMPKKIIIGGKTAKELAREIKKKGDEIEGYTEKELMGNKDFKPLKKAEKLDLVILSVKDLGFPDGATIREIYEKAQELGLKLVPAEVGPQLRLQYEDQPMGEWLLVGMEPLTVSSGFLNVFHVSCHDYGRRLLSGSGNPDSRWYGHSRCVFARK